MPEFPHTLRPAIRVLLVDDHPLIRQGFRRILHGAFSDLVLGEAETGEEALERFTGEPWDLVVLDLSLPGVSGLEVLRKIRGLRPDTRVIIISVHPPTHFARRALAAGAVAYIEKRAATEEMIKAVAEVLAGRTYVSPSTPPADVTEAGAGRVPHEQLSDREYQVLCMLGVGKTVSQIAGELDLSVKTVSTYRARILEKMELGTTSELMHYVIDHGLVP
jgi:two-component system invasion response regulator UvrY